MKFSVIIPTCDRVNLLMRCLAGLQKAVDMLGEPVEVIISDDRYSPEAAIQIEKSFPSFRYLKGPGIGPAANRNNGAKKAMGDWFVWTDDDCIPSLDWLKAFSKAIEQHPKVEVFEGKTTIGCDQMPPLKTAPENLKGGYLWSCNFCLRADLFRALDGFDSGFPFPHLEDVDFRERLRSFGKTFLFIEDAVIVHPPRPLTKWKRQAKALESHFYYAAKHQIDLGESGLSLKGYFRPKVVRLLQSQTVSELLTHFLRDVKISFYLAAHWMQWKRKYRKVTDA